LVISTLHHDLWDYDTAAQPLLFTFRGDIPAVAVTNKTGMVYVLDRRTGTPIYPVYERSVPASDVPGEQASRTQPFSSLPPLNPLKATLSDACLQKASNLKYGGIFTPPSLAGSLEYPGKLGGVNWGSAAYDPETGVYYAATNRAPFEVRLIPRNWLSDVTTLSSARLVQSLPFVRPRILLIGLALMVSGLIGSLFRRSLMIGSYLGLGILGLAGLQLISFQFLVNRLQFKRLHSILGVDDSPMYETPFTLYLRPLTDRSGAPCTGQPWGAITAVNLQTAQRVWEKPLGTMIEGAHTGSLELGGPIVAAGGLVFAAGTRDPYLRAFDKSNGEELWRGRLPAPAQATPMTYSMKGRQFVVIAAGGHGLFNTEQGDSLVAFALKKE
jgi:quinoprotein glucose dehydrogenase